MDEAMRIDFTDVEASKGFSLVPDGKYLFEVTGATEGIAGENAKNAGAVTINWENTILETVTGETVVQDRSGSEIKVLDRKIWDTSVIAEGGLGRLKAFLDACGFDVSGEIDFDPQEVIGSQFVGKVGVRKGNKDKVTGQEYSDKNVIRSFEPSKSE